MCLWTHLRNCNYNSMKQMNIITKGVSVKYFMIAYFPIKVYIINFDNILTNFKNVMKYSSKPIGLSKDLCWKIKVLKVSSKWTFLKVQGAQDCLLIQIILDHSFDTFNFQRILTWNQGFQDESFHEMYNWNWSLSKFNLIMHLGMFQADSINP